MADIGDKLKSAREAKGLSIQDIEKATKIQSRYLEAIENNEFDKLPGDFTLEHLLDNMLKLLA